jgi:hypothetical protein
LKEGKPKGTAGRIALPVAGDDPKAKSVIIGLIDEIGFDGVDAGPLDESWRQQPDTPVYGSNLDVERLKQALQQASPERKPKWRATPNSPGNFLSARHKKRLLAMSERDGMGQLSRRGWLAAGAAIGTSLATYGVTSDATAGFHMQNSDAVFRAVLTLSQRAELSSPDGLFAARAHAAELLAFLDAQTRCNTDVRQTD